MLTTILLAVGTFLATNIDDFVLLMIFSSEDKGNKIANRHIWLGQFFSIGLIVGLGLLGAWLFKFLPGDLNVYVKWIGLATIALGLYELFVTLVGKREQRHQKHRSTIKKIKENQQNNPKEKDTTFWHIFLMLFGAGFNNLGVYIPLFLGMAWAKKCVSLAVYAVLTVVICWIAILLSKNNTMAKVVSKAEAYLVPIILILIGILVILGIG